MRKIIYSLIAVVLLFGFLQPVLAVDSSYFNVVQTMPTVRVEIVESTVQTINRIKNSYGTSNYNYCFDYYNCDGSSAPWNIKSCLSFVESCSKQRAQQQKVMEEARVRSIQCPAKTINVNGACVCDTAKGYVFRDGGCYIPLPVKTDISPLPSDKKVNNDCQLKIDDKCLTYDQYCNSQFGLGGIAVVTSNNGWHCGCDKGYTEKSINDRLKCIPIQQVQNKAPETIKQIATNTEITMEEQKINNTSTDTKTLTERDISNQIQPNINGTSNRFFKIPILGGLIKFFSRLFNK